MQATLHSAVSNSSHSSPSSPSETNKSSTMSTSSSSPFLSAPVPPAASWSNILSRIHWIHCFILLGTPFLTLYAVMYVPLTRVSFVWAFIYYFMTGTGITAGYHRLWAHKSYDASWPVQFYLLLCGTGALEGSIKWWCGGHRIHHRFTDTRFDPYNSQGGLFYSHFGWMLVHPRKENYRKADISDLNASKMIRLQHRYYLIFGPVMALLFPALVAHLLFGDFRGGFFFAGVVRLFFVHHSTFCVNSIAHYLGEATFDDGRTPRDHILTALVTFGEGYHNFHHEFPNDYRNAIQWYQYDPTKWLIRFWYEVGLVYNLKQFSNNEIQMGVVTMKEKKLNELKQNVKWPIAVNNLSTMTRSEFERRCGKNKSNNNNNNSAAANSSSSSLLSGGGEQLTIINSVVHDISSFIHDHPGGVAIIRMAIGEDATHHFTGHSGIYKHSNAAYNLLAQFRVAVLVDDNQSLAVTTDDEVNEQLNSNNNNNNSCDEKQNGLTRRQPKQQQQQQQKKSADDTDTDTDTDCKQSLPSDMTSAVAAVSCLQVSS